MLLRTITSCIVDVYALGRVAATV